MWRWSFTKIHMLPEVIDLRISFEICEGQEDMNLTRKLKMDTKNASKCLLNINRYRWKMTVEMEWLIESHISICDDHRSIPDFRLSSFFTSPAYNIFPQIPHHKYYHCQRCWQMEKDEKQQKHENEISLAPEKTLNENCDWLHVDMVKWFFMFPFR